MSAVATTGFDAKTRAARRKGRTLSIATVLALSFGLLVVLAVALVLFIGVMSSGKNTVDLLNEKSMMIVDLMETGVRNHLDPAMNQAVFIERQVRDGLINLDDRDAFDLSSLRALHTASAPISEHDIARFQAYSGASLISNYGLTEIPGAAVERADTQHHPGSVGQLSPGFEALARDDDGTPLPPGKTGEITLRGPTLMAGYLGDREQTARRVRGGWIYTQDVGHVDAEGRIFLSGRMSDMIIRGGLNISPLEIEAVLSAHDAVAEAAVVGAPDRVLGQVVVACIVPSPAADRSTIFDALTTHCRQFLSAPKVPAAIHLLDALPRNAGGKIVRKELVRHLEDQPAGNQTINWSKMKTG